MEKIRMRIALWIMPRSALRDQFVAIERDYRLFHFTGRLIRLWSEFRDSFRCESLTDIVTATMKIGSADVEMKIVHDSTDGPLYHATLGNKPFMGARMSSMWIRMSVTKWEELEFDVNFILPARVKAPGHGSIGICEVFDDLAKAKAAYPKSEFVEIVEKEQSK